MTRAISESYLRYRVKEKVNWIPQTTVHFFKEYVWYSSQSAVRANNPGDVTDTWDTGFCCSSHSGPWARCSTVIHSVPAGSLWLFHLAPSCLIWVETNKQANKYPRRPVHRVTKVCDSIWKEHRDLKDGSRGAMVCYSTSNSNQLLRGSRESSRF